MPDRPFPLSGVFAAVLTPMKDDKSADVARLAAHCRWLLANGCDGLGVLGTTGEANSFGLKERIAIVEGLAEAGIPGQTMMPGTGCCAVPDTVSLTRTALDAGAAGVLMLPPFYYKNVSDDGLFAAYSEVIQRLGDTRLKIYLYHFPQMSGVPITNGLIERLVAAYPDTVVGMKDSSGEIENMAGAAERFPGFAVFSGGDELLLPLLRRGGAGCITACSNVVSSIAGALYGEWTANGDTPACAELHARLSAVRDVITAHGLFPSLKALMARHSGDAAWLNCRPPLVALDAAARDRLFADFDALGVDLPAAA